MPKGVYKRTKPVWNKGKNKFTSRIIKEYSKKCSETKQRRFKEYKSFELEYGKEKAQDMIKDLYNVTYGKECNDKVKEYLSNMKKNIIDEFINLTPKLGSKKEKNEIYLIKKYIVLIRDNFECQICGSKKKNVVHHIINTKLLEDPDLPNNMITLCISCHSRLENILSMLYYGQSRRKIDNIEEYLKHKYKVPIEKAKWINENLINSVGNFLQKISFPLETTRSAPKKDDDIVRHSDINKTEE